MWLDAVLTNAVGEAARFLLGLANYYTDGVPVVTVPGHSTCSNDSTTLVEVRITLRLFRKCVPSLLYPNAVFA